MPINSEYTVSDLRGICLRALYLMRPLWGGYALALFYKSRREL